MTNYTGSFYLIVSCGRYNGLRARLTTKKPSLTPGEVALDLRVSLPETLFKRPQLKASITVPESAVSAPVLDAKVLDNVREVLEQQTGMRVDVAVIDPTRPEVQ